MDQYSSPLRVATYNIRKSVGLDRRRDPGRVLDVINQLDSDIVALQEADLRLGARASTLSRREIERSTDLEAIEIAVNDVSLGWHGNAILVRKGARVSWRDRIDLPSLEPRGAAMAELSWRDAHIRVVALHLGLTRKMRQAQLRAITGAISDRPDMATIIMGDFNEWKANLGVEALSQAYQVHSPGRSFHAARPVASLDRIAVSRALSMTDAGVKQTRQSLIASDHLPVWADFQINR